MRSADQTMRLTFPGGEGRPDEARSDAIPIRGLAGDLPVSFAPNGGAVPGDRIVGILTPGVGVTIYPIQSAALAAFDNEPERWIDVRWDVEAAQRRALPGPPRAAIHQRAGRASPRSPRSSPTTTATSTTSR